MQIPRNMNRHTRAAGSWFFVCFIMVLCVPLSPALGQSGTILSPMSGADGVYDTVLLNGTTVYRSTGSPGSYSLYMYFKSPASVHNQTVYLEVTYVDAGLGYIGVQYNSTSGNYQGTTTQYQNYCQQTGRTVTAVFQLTAADFRGAQNLGADLRLWSDPGNQKQIVSATVYFSPTAAFLKYQPNWMGPYLGLTYAGDNLVDATTLNGKTICGYQGWFRTPADFTGLGWQHYFRSSFNEPVVDLWPDITEYTTDEQYPVTGWRLTSGKPAYLFSAANKRTVLRHFQWMEAYGLDCAEVQRFVVSIGATGDPQNYRVLCYEREAANRTGRSFFVNYDLSGVSPADVIAKVGQDWRYLVDSLKLTSDQRYQRHNGRPVVGLFGFYSDRYSAAGADSILKIFEGSGPYAAFVKGSGEWWWRTETAPGWGTEFRKMGAYTPWNVGNYSGSGSTAEASTGFWLQDKQTLDAAGSMYIPLIYPGFSWDNLMNQAPGTTNVPRKRGAFLWNQILAAKQIGAAAVYVAMFDEIDEGTAIFKTTNDVPQNHYFLPLETGLPSDFYLSLTGYGEKIIKGSVSVPGSMPDFTVQSQPPIPDIVTPWFGDTISNRLTVVWTRVTHASGITGYELEFDRVVSAVSDTASTRTVSDGTHRVRVRAVNGLGIRGGWSEVHTFLFRTVVTPSVAPLVSPPDRTTGLPLAVKFSWRKSADATSYTLQVSPNDTFSTGVLADSSAADTVKQVLLPSQGTRYFWRVRGRNAGAAGPWSDVWQFATAAALPQAPSLSLPADGEISVQLNATLSWTSASGATFYHLQLSTNPIFTLNIVDDSSLTTTSRPIGPLSLATTYFWRVRGRNSSGYSAFSPSRQFSTIRTTAVEQAFGAIPKDYALNQNYPNPFNPSTKIVFAVPKSSVVRLSVIDERGRTVAVLASGEKSAGWYELTWDASKFPSGTYFCCLQARQISGGQAGEFVETKKMILLR